MNFKDLKKTELRKKGERWTFYERLGVPLLQRHVGKKLVYMDRRKIGSSMEAVRNNGDIEIRYYDHPVITMHKKGGMSFSACGWQTAGTKGKIEAVLPKGFYLYSFEGLWYITKGWSYSKDSAKYGYADGMTIYENGEIEDALTPADLADKRRFARKAKRFIKRFLDKLVACEVEPPGLGDCLYCQVEAGSQKTQLGVLTKDGVRPHTFAESADHVRSHIDEGYFVPSMLMNAVNEMGGPQACYAPTRSVMYYLWQEKDKEKAKEYMKAFDFCVRRDFNKALRNYVFRRIGLVVKMGMVHRRAA